MIFGEIDELMLRKCVEKCLVHTHFLMHLSYNYY